MTMEVPENFLFHFPYRVGIADINYGGHVANSAVLNIFQDARIAYLAELGPFSEIDLGGCGLILPEAHVYYRQEMFLDDRINVGVQVASLKRSSFLMRYRIERDGETTVDGETQLACYDYAKGKVCRIPADLRNAIEIFESL